MAIGGVSDISFAVGWRISAGGGILDVSMLFICKGV